MTWWSTTFAVVTLTGKGRKTRQVPLMAPTAQLVADYLTERRLLQPDRRDHPLFYNRQRHKLTRAGVTYILTKYVEQARACTAVAFPARVTPHILRHTKAMHLVQANVNLVYIRDVLGHADVTTTEIYARVDAERKRQALAQAGSFVVTEGTTSDWTGDPDLMRWLRRVCAPSS